MFRIEGGPMLQNGETLQAHRSLDNASAYLSRLRQMLGTVDGGLTGKSEAGDTPYSPASFSVSADQLLTDLNVEISFLTVYLGQVSDALSKERVDADEADDE